SPAPAAAAVQENFGRLPLSFEANVGQADAQVQYLARGAGYSLFLTATEAVMTLTPPQGSGSRGQESVPPERAWRGGPAFQPAWVGPAGKADRQPATADRPSTVRRMQNLGGDPRPPENGRNQPPGKVHY